MSLSGMVAGVNLPAGSRCIKYLMFIFNLIFVITGIILISIGSVILGVYRNYTHFLDNEFFSVPSLLIAIGLIIFFIAFFGCCGAVRENYCMIVTFAVLMVLVFILELAGGISGYVLRSSAQDIITEKMKITMREYQISPEIASAWDEIQQTFTCCGLDGKKDWEPFMNESLPMSCCKPEIGVIGSASCTAASLNVFPDGCMENLLVFVKEHAIQLGGAGLGIAFIQLLGIWFSIYLAKSIKNSYETV